MKALVYSAPEQFTVTEVPTPEPRGTEVLIRVRACGLCKTDVHIHHGHFFSAFPLIPGHEFAGEVAAVGAEVTGVKVGERVTADNERQCGACYYCRRGEPLFCEHLYAQGVNAPGGFAEYVLVEERQVYHLAEQISFLEGALIEPTACAVHGIDVIRPRAGDEVLQFGAGPTGLILAQLLRDSGAACLLVADLSPLKLEPGGALRGGRSRCRYGATTRRRISRRLKRCSRAGSISWWMPPGSAAWRKACRALPNTAPKSSSTASARRTSAFRSARTIFFGAN